MSARAVREEDKPRSSGLGVAAAAAVVGVGLGVGAALYYFLKPNNEERQRAERQQANADAAQAFGGEDGRPLSWELGSELRRVVNSVFNTRSDSEDTEEEWEASPELSRQRAFSVEQCSICFEEMPVASELWALPCGHKFHLQCVRVWTEEHNTCPNCRKNI